MTEAGDAMKSPLPRRRLGRSGIEVSSIGMGCAPLGELFVRVDDATAQATLQAAWDGGIRYFDTAPEYGLGLSEHRVGQFLRQPPRSEFLLSTKVGRLLRAPPTSRSTKRYSGPAASISTSASTTVTMRSCGRWKTATSGSV